MRREYDRQKKGKQKDYLCKVLQRAFLKLEKKLEMERVENLRVEVGWFCHELRSRLDPVRLLLPT
jgi:hypothetical protein